MSPEGNVEVVHRFVDAFNRLDMDLITADLDPAVELHEWPEAPGARSYRGPDGVGEALGVWFDVWEWMQVEITDIREVGNQILFTLHQRAKGKGSEVEVEVESHNVYTFEDGKVTRIELFIERDSALAAAGLTASLKEDKR